MTITLEIDAHIDARLDALAHKTGQDKAILLRQLIEGNIEDLEDYYDAAEVLDRIRQGEKTYTEEEVRREIGLDD